MKGLVRYLIAANRLQAVYNDLYVEMRKYIWDFKIVEALGNLEVCTYQAFPDLNELSSLLSKLRREVEYTSVLSDDEDLKDCFEAFHDMIEDADSVYYNLISFKEVASNEPEDSEEEPIEEGKSTSIRVNFHRKS